MKLSVKLSRQNITCSCHDIAEKLLIYRCHHNNNPTKRVGLVQSGHHHHLIEIELILAMIYLKNSSFGVKQSLAHLFILL